MSLKSRKLRTQPNRACRLRNSQRTQNDGCLAGAFSPDFSACASLARPMLTPKNNAICQILPARCAFDLMLNIEYTTNSIEFKFSKFAGCWRINVPKCRDTKKRPESLSPAFRIRSVQVSVAAEQRLPDDGAKRRAGKRCEPEQPDLAQRASVGKDRRAK